MVSKGFPDGSVEKNSSFKAGDMGLIPGLGGSLGEGSDNPFQDSCLVNPMDKGAWWTTDHRMQRVRHN